MSGRDLMVSCPSCRLNVVLTYGGDGRYLWHPWICPHCAVQNGINLAGAILLVRKPQRES